MHPILTAAALLVTLALNNDCRADDPATEFFAIESTKLAKLAPTDTKLDSISATRLTEISIAHGWYAGGLAMRFLTSTFRIDARFGGSANTTVDSLKITYRIDASNDQTGWNLLSEKGTATKQGKQFVTDDWRNRKIVVILRYVDLKQ